MNTLDRFVRIIYREQLLSDYLVLESTQTNHCFDLDKRLTEAFEMDNLSFKKRIAELYLSVYPDNYNPDEVDEMISWMEQKLNKKHYNAIDLLICIVKELLFYQDGELTVSFDDFLEWNGFINKIDQNILYSLFLALHQIEHHKHKNLITHDNYRLKELLSKGMSENHMHLKGSGYTTDMNWYYFYSKPEFLYWSTTDFMPRHSVFKKNNQALAFDKLRLVRLYLVQLAHVKDSAKHEQCLTDADWLKILYAKADYPVILLDLSKKIEFLFSITEQIDNQYGSLPNKYIMVERELLKNVFELYLQGNLSALQKYLLNTYILGISQFKFFFYQDNINMGFEKFKWSENIKEHFLPNDSDFEIYKTVFDKYYSENKVTQIEFRVTPRTYNSLIQMIDELDQANDIVSKLHKRNSSEEKIEYGLVCHYIKDKSEFELKDGLSRKEKFLSKLNTSSQSLSALLCSCDSVKSEDDTNDSLSYYINKIVGIDTANYEFDCRPELFGCTFRRHRKEAEKSHPLRFTYHVGEDFNTLANGLRAIDEVIEFLQFKRGDRLGHAIALGVDAEHYFKTKRQKVISTLEEYLDDIVWMYTLLSDSANSETGVLEYLFSEFEKYKHLYFSQNHNISLFDYADAYHLRGDDPYSYIHTFNVSTSKEYKKLIEDKETLLNHQALYHQTSFMNPVAREIYYQYHFSSQIKKAGREVMIFDVHPSYKQAVISCQKLLKEKIYHLEISIETNPSSNRKISHVNKYIDLPLLDFSPLKYEVNDCPLLVSINTDDSAIFQTDLQSEYAYIVAAQIREGENIEMVYKHINKLRKNSLTTNFLEKSKTHSVALKVAQTK